MNTSRSLSDGWRRNLHPGRPRHLPADDALDPAYTLICEEPLVVAVTAALIVVSAVEVAVVLSDRTTTAAHLSRSVFYIPLIAGFAMMTLHSATLLVFGRMPSAWFTATPESRRAAEKVDPMIDLSDEELPS